MCVNFFSSVFNKFNSLKATRVENYRYVTKLDGVYPVDNRPSTD